MNEYLKIFLAIGAPIGFVFGIFSAVSFASIDLKFGILAGLTNGVFLGMLHGGGLTIFFAFSHKIYAKPIPADISQRPNGVLVRNFELPISYDEAFECSLNALNLIPRTRIQDEDRDKGMIFARVGIRSKSFGDRISIIVTKTGEESVHIEVTSGPVLGMKLFDYGTSLDNVDNICAFFNDYNA
jgi:hypothetical protein